MLQKQILVTEEKKVHVTETCFWQKKFLLEKQKKSQKLSSQKKQVWSHKQGSVSVSVKEKYFCHGKKIMVTEKKFYHRKSFPPQKKNSVREKIFHQKSKFLSQKRFLPQKQVSVTKEASFKENKFFLTTYKKVSVAPENRSIFLYDNKFTSCRTLSGYASLTILNLHKIGAAKPKRFGMLSLGIK